MPSFKPKPLLIFGGMILALIFLIVIYSLYSNTLIDVKQNHQNQQREMAKEVALGIESYINHLNYDLDLLSKYAFQRSIDNSELNLTTKLFQEHYTENIKSVFVLDSEGNTVSSSGDPFLNSDINKLIDKNRSSILNSKGIFVSSVEPLNRSDTISGLHFILAKTIDKFNPNLTNGNFDEIIGACGFVINFDSLVHRFILPLRLGKEDFAWVIDDNSRLIYHPRHKEMLFMSLNDSTSGCNSCHQSFDIVKKMLTTKNFTGEYIVGDEPEKIMASASFNLGNRKWVIAISTFLPNVTENLRERFNIFFLLGIVILIVIFTLGGLLYYSNSKRLKAEEEMRLSNQRQIYQDQLNSAVKLASIGELVDSVAHEINTPLGIISTHSDALLYDNNFPGNFRDSINIIKDQSKRINKFTKSLLGYSKRIPFQPGEFLISGIIDECLYLLDYKIRSKGITLKRDYPKDEIKLRVDRGQLEQVFFNILINSIDAVDRSIGEISIKIVQQNEPAINKNLCSNIVFLDNGCGIDEENLERIFDTFYSNKRNENGTGLGLSISKAIVNRHRGRIMVKSEVLKFTEFTITLPMNEESYC